MRTRRRRGTRGLGPAVGTGVGVIVLASVLTACSGSDGDATAARPSSGATSTAKAPDAFEAPDGVTLTAGGSKIRVGRPATVVYRVGDSAASAVTVSVTAAKKGSIDDFRFFSLDDDSKASTPYYVTVGVRNDGPAGLGGVALPLFAVDSTGTSFPANDIVGTFEPCPVRALPASFLPGATAELCLVYLVPKGRTLRSIAWQTGTAEDAISWTR